MRGDFLSAFHDTMGMNFVLSLKKKKRAWFYPADTADSINYVSHFPFTIRHLEPNLCLLIATDINVYFFSATLTLYYFPNFIFIFPFALRFLFYPDISTFTDIAIS